MALILAQDSFNRTSAAGSWGAADTGGVWTLTGGNSQFLVDPGWGRVSLQPSYDRAAYLNGVLSANAVIRVAMSSSSAYVGSAQNFTIVGRKISSAYYQARVRIENGLLRLYTMRDETALTGSTTISHAYAAGEVIWCELAVTGTNPTTVSAKMWLDGDVEPGSYQQSTTDSTPGYQTVGVIGLRANIGASAASAIMSFGNYSATDPTTNVLDTPVVVLQQAAPTTIGGSDGSITATWTAVSGADHYESQLVAGAVTSGFTADDTNAVSPKTYSGLPAGAYTVAVRAKAN